MQTDSPPRQSTLATALTLLWATLAGTLAAVTTLVTGVVSWTLRSARTLGETVTRIAIRTIRLTTGDRTRRLLGILRVHLFGRSATVSVMLVLAAPLLAVATAWWVASGVGYHTLASWVVGTWFGTDPQTAVFLAVAALLGAATVSVASNSGLVPTFLLVAGPLFGAGVTRYGTERLLRETTVTVSLPEALVSGATVALAFGIPIALAGFVLGTLLRGGYAIVRRDVPGMGTA